MCKTRIRDHIKDPPADRIESRNRQPENAQQMYVTLHSSGARLHNRHRAHDLLATAVAEPLARLNRSAASIAEHGLFSPCSSARFFDTNVRRIRRYAHRSQEFRILVISFGSNLRMRSFRQHRSQTKRPPGNRVTSSFQGRIVPTEL